MEENMKFKKMALIGAVAVTSVALAACSNTDNSTQGGTKVTQKSSKKKSTIKYYKVGDTVRVGKVEYTLKSVETTSERNEFEDSKPKNVIKVTYHVKNNGKEDLAIGTDLNVYGPDNSKLKEYPLNDQTFDSVAAGKEADVITGFGANKLGDFELQFAPLISTEKAAKFKVNVK